MYLWKIYLSKLNKENIFNTLSSKTGTRVVSICPYRADMDLLSPASTFSPTLLLIIETIWLSRSLHLHDMDNFSSLQSSVEYYRLDMVVSSTSKHLNTSTLASSHSSILQSSSLALSSSHDLLK